MGGRRASVTDLPTPALRALGTIKVALVTWGYNKHQGIARCVAELAERLARVHEVHVFTPHWEEERSAPIVFHRVPVIFHRWYLTVPVFFLVSGRLLRRHQFDIIHLHAPSYHHAHIVTCHSVPQAGIEYLRKLPREGTMALPPRRVLPYVLLRSVFAYNFRGGLHKRVIALSDRIRQELIKFYRVGPEKILLIPNGVDPEGFHPRHRERLAADVRAQYGLPEKSFVFLVVGHDFRQKGLQFVLRALRLMRAKNVRLLVVGPLGADATYFKWMAETLGMIDQLVFAGFQREISRFYAAADCFVFPSLYESFSLVVLEAMASGLPVITTKTVGGATDLIDDGISGFLLDNPWHVEELAEKMELVIRDEDLRGELGRNARKVAEQYSWDRNTDRTLQAYAEVLR